MPTVQPIPDGYHTIQPYLHIRGAAHAIDFYKAAFAAVEILRLTQPDGSIGHAELRFGDSVVMLADEAPERAIYSPTYLGGSAVSIMIYVEDCDALYRRAIAAGARSIREPVDQFYGDRSAGVQDPFGFQWWIATHIKDVAPDELQAAAAAQTSS